MIVCGTIIKGEIDANINNPSWGIIGMGVSLLLLSIGLITWKFYKDKNISAKEAKRIEEEREKARQSKEEELLQQEIEDEDKKVREADQKAKRIREESLKTLQKEREEQSQREKRQKEDEMSRKKILEAEQDTKKAEAELEAQRHRAAASILKARQRGFFPKGTINAQGPSTIYTGTHTNPESKTKPSDTGLGLHTIFGD